LTPVRLAVDLGAAVQAGLAEADHDLVAILQIP
jgi:hypothetical protein